MKIDIAFNLLNCLKNDLKTNSFENECRACVNYLFREITHKKIKKTHGTYLRFFNKIFFNFLFNYKNKINVFFF